MLIRRTSMLTGKYNEMNISVTKEQIDAWQAGQLIQDAMPNLTADEREFIKTGITPDEWDTAFRH